MDLPVFLRVGHSLHSRGERARGPYPIILPDFYRRGPPEEISVHVGEVPPAELAQLPEKVTVAEGEVVYGPEERGGRCTLRILLFGV